MSNGDDLWIVPLAIAMEGQTLALPARETLSKETTRFVFLVDLWLWETMPEARNENSMSSTGALRSSWA